MAASKGTKGGVTKPTVKRQKRLKNPLKAWSFSYYSRITKMQRKKIGNPLKQAWYIQIAVQAWK